MEHAPAHGPRRDGERLAFLESLACAAEQVLRESGTSHACIGAAQIVRAVARAHGLDTIIVPTRVAVWNSVWIDFVGLNGRPPSTRTESESLLNAGGWCVAIGAGYPDDREARFGYSAERGSYNGHLVAVVEGRWLVDPTLGQTADAARGLVTGPLVAEIGSSAFLLGIAHFASRFRWGTHPQVHVTYEAVPEDQSYRATPAWRAPGLGLLARRAAKIARTVPVA